MSPIGLIVIIALIVILASGFYPPLGYSRSYPVGGGLSVVIVVLIVLLLVGRL